MTLQQARDYSTMIKIWHMFRDFGDIQNTEEQADRWDALVEFVETNGQMYHENRRLFADALAIIETRARQAATI